MYHHTRPVDDRSTVFAPAPPRLAALATAVPGGRWRQEDTYRYLAERIPHYRSKVIESVFHSAGINHRNLAHVPGGFDPAPPPDELHLAFESHALNLAERAARKALDQAGLSPRDIYGVVVATSTGYLCPGVAARVAPRLGLSDSAMRTEIVGAGCAGALPALRRAHDFLYVHPYRRVLVVCVEVCSACAYVDDDLETAVGMAICADGAAAVILEGAAVAQRAENARTQTSMQMPTLTAFQTAANPDHLDSVGFAHRGGRLRIVLSKQIPDIAAAPVRDAVGRSLAREGLTVDAVDHWVVHSGGRRVLDRLTADLSLAKESLAPSRAVLADHGNMSSPTVLFVLAETLKTKRPKRGSVGVLVALGPGLVAESAVLRW